MMQKIKCVKLQPGKTCDAMWASTEEIKKLVADEKFIPQNVFPYLDKLFEIYG